MMHSAMPPMQVPSSSAYSHRDFDVDLSNMRDFPDGDAIGRMKSFCGSRLNEADDLCDRIMTRLLDDTLPINYKKPMLYLVDAIMVHIDETLKVPREHNTYHLVFMGHFDKDSSRILTALSSDIQSSLVKLFKGWGGRRLFSKPLVDRLISEASLTNIVPDSRISLASFLQAPAPNYQFHQQPQHQYQLQQQQSYNQNAGPPAYHHQQQHQSQQYHQMSQQLPVINQANIYHQPHQSGVILAAPLYQQPIVQPPIMHQQPIYQQPIYQQPQSLYQNYPSHNPATTLQPSYQQHHQQQHQQRPVYNNPPPPAVPRQGGQNTSNYSSYQQRPAYQQQAHASAIQIQPVLSQIGFPSNQASSSTTTTPAVPNQQDSSVASGGSNGSSGKSARVLEMMLQVWEELLPGSQKDLDDPLKHLMASNLSLYNTIYSAAEQNLSDMYAFNLDRALFIVKNIEQLAEKLATMPEDSSATQSEMINADSIPNSMSVGSALKNSLNSFQISSSSNNNSSSSSSSSSSSNKGSKSSIGKLDGVGGREMPSMLSGTLPLEPSVRFLASLDERHACRRARSVVKKPIPVFKLDALHQLTAEKKDLLVRLGVGVGLYPSFQSDDGLRFRSKKDLEAYNVRIKDRRLESEFQRDKKKMSWYVIAAKFIDKNAASGSATDTSAIDATKKNASYTLPTAKYGDSFMTCAISNEKFSSTKNVETGGYDFTSVAKLFVTSSAEELFEIGLSAYDNDEGESSRGNSNNSSNNNNDSSNLSGSEDMDGEQSPRLDYEDATKASEVQFKFVLVQLNSVVESQMSQGRIVSMKEAKARYQIAGRDDYLAEIMRVEAALLSQASRADLERDEKEKGETVAGERVLFMLEN